MIWLHWPMGILTDSGPIRSRLHCLGEVLVDMVAVAELMSELPSTSQSMRSNRWDLWLNLHLVRLADLFAVETMCLCYCYYYWCCCYCYYFDLILCLMHCSNPKYHKYENYCVVLALSCCPIICKEKYNKKQLYKFLSIQFGLVSSNAKTNG